MHTTGFLLAAVPVVILMPTRPIAPVVITVYVCVGTLPSTPTCAGPSARRAGWW